MASTSGTIQNRTITACVSLWFGLVLFPIFVPFALHNRCRPLGFSTRSKSQENITYLESCLQNGHWKRGIRFGTQPHAKVRVDHCFWMRNSVKKHMDEKVEGKHEVPIHLKTIINTFVNF